jgi:hypothetical protein
MVVLWIGLVGQECSGRRHWRGAAGGVGGAEGDGASSGVNGGRGVERQRAVSSLA